MSQKLSQESKDLIAAHLKQALTAIPSDPGYDKAFARQVEGLGARGGVLREPPRK